MVFRKKSWYVVCTMVSTPKSHGTWYVPWYVALKSCGTWYVPWYVPWYAFFTMVCVFIPRQIPVRTPNHHHIIRLRRQTQRNASLKALINVTNMMGLYNLK